MLANQTLGSNVPPLPQTGVRNGSLRGNFSEGPMGKTKERPAAKDKAGKAKSTTDRHAKPATGRPQKPVPKPAAAKPAAAKPVAKAAPPAKAATGRHEKPVAAKPAAKTATGRHEKPIAKTADKAVEKTSKGSSASRPAVKTPPPAKPVTDRQAKPAAPASNGSAKDAPKKGDSGSRPAVKGSDSGSRPAIRAITPSASKGKSTVVTNTNGRSSPFSTAELREWRDLLVDRRAEISTDIHGLEKDAMEAEDGHTTPLHAAERGSDADLQEVSLGLAGEEKELIWQIDRALRKIDLGAPLPFGLCEHTREPISKNRLQLIPWTPLSIEGAQHMEESGLSLQDMLIDD